MKIIKLLILAIIIVGGIALIAYLNIPSSPLEEPEYGNPQATEWKNKIKELCKKDDWTVDGYTNIESGIHSDRVTSHGELITIDEENSLQAFLFASSCIYLKENADDLFQQSTYPNDRLSRLDAGVELLLGKVDKYEANSNLSEASKMSSAYHRLIGLLSFGAKARYFRPLEAYSGGSPEGRKSTIQSLPYYKSHFSNNTSIKERVDRLEADMIEAEEQYYSSLEQLVEEHFRTTKNIEELLEDQMVFEEISTNTTSKSKLKDFVNNSFN